MNTGRILIEQIVYPAMEKLKGNKIRSYLQELKLSQEFTRQMIAELQRERLRKLLKHCIENVPAYRQFRHLAQKIDVSPYAALQEFPVLTKSHFTRHADEYLAQGVDKAALICNRTGGSTGEPVRFYLDRITVEHYEAARWRGLSWWGIGLGDPSVMIWGSPIEMTHNQSRIYRLKERLLKNRIIIPAYALDPGKARYYVDLLNSFAPEYIYGYASALHAFAQLMNSQGLRITKRLKGVVSTAETLFDDQRTVIENSFSARVINEYGARDAGIIAYQCPSGSMHVTEENLVVETVDIETGNRVENGRSGLVTVTDLHNYSMPRLRYQLGDVARLSNESCKCGKQLWVLQEIEGREDDIFVSKEGKLVHGHFWNHIARNMHGIKQFQLIQHDNESVTLKIVKNEKFKPEEVEYFVRQIRNVLGDSNINVVYCEGIEPTVSGKLRYAVREFPILLERVNER